MIRAKFRMMISHSTLDCHVTLARSLDGSDGQIKTLTLYNDPNTNPNEKFDILRHVSFSSINILTLPYRRACQACKTIFELFYY